VISFAPWFIAAAGLALCFAWRFGAPDWIAGKGNESDFAYSSIAILFGSTALFVDRKYVNASSAFFVEAFALLFYWMICRGIMGGPK
jgi:hypothetical protein